MATVKSEERTVNGGGWVGGMMMARVEDGCRTGRCELVTLGNAVSDLSKGKIFPLL